MTPGLFRKIRLVDLGLMDYGACLDLQRRLHRKRALGGEGDTLLVVEHPTPVFTLGRNADRNNLFLSQDAMERRGIRCFEVERGGDVTYHGPGQLVVYAILGMEKDENVLALVHTLEEVMIRILEGLGLEGARDPRNRGAWVDRQKVGFVGLAVLRGVSIHGMALNVDPDMDFFAAMNPCGMPDVEVTSIARLLQRPVGMEEVKSLLPKALQETFGPGVIMAPGDSRHP